MKRTVLLFLTLIGSASASGQFVDHFESDVDGWTYRSGNGNAEIDFVPRENFASIQVDATQDRRNIWWAIIRRELSDELDLERASRPGHEIRIEARIRSSHAPRRVNLHLNTQRTTDFHSHLMEFDIPDTTDWHRISMTTEDFDVRPGDTVGAQLALMDWGLERYRLDVDYFRVSVVDVDTVGPDHGEQVPYRPTLPDLAGFDHEVDASQAATIDGQFPDINLGDWYVADAAGHHPVIAVS
ncbi:MAG: hypothetical protein ACOCTG_05675, partial [Bacteroidota bacterium]